MLRIGIFFGGSSCEREVSFMSGRTVYDNLDRSCFVPVPVFVNRVGHFIIIEWNYLYHGTIRDFYPDDDVSTEQELDAATNRVGKRIYPHQFQDYFDIVFLSLHGPYGEDGCIQGLLDWHHIPYTGSGVLGSSLGIDKAIQRQLMKQAGMPVPEFRIVTSWELESITPDKLQQQIIDQLGTNIVVKPVRQGSSIGITVIQHPDELWGAMKLASSLGDTESSVLIESYLTGREFSCIILEPELGKLTILPPTEIKTDGILFDYRAKYLPGIVHKETPMCLTPQESKEIRDQSLALYRMLHFCGYARIDGFLCADGVVYLNDPNTTAGMSPSSFLFHQAAIVGINPANLLTLLIQSALNYYKRKINLFQVTATEKNKSKVRVGILMGGFSAERHISLESGRNIYEKLSSSTKYEPFPMFLSGTKDSNQLYTLPLYLMFKDNADDIHGLINRQIPQVDWVDEAVQTLKPYGAHAQEAPCQLNYAMLPQYVDFVFLALHGRPGEDGQLQAQLENIGLPYNGSGVQTSQLTIDKWKTNRFLSDNGVYVAKACLMHREDWVQDIESCIMKVEEKLGYPMIAKPVDEGCSEAVERIEDYLQLCGYAEKFFNKKDVFLLESCIRQGDALHFLEITGGVITHSDSGYPNYEAFSPSETLSSSNVLSLEEKFLAGAGQNITPARFDSDSVRQNNIENQVRQDLRRVAELLKIDGYARIDAFVKVYADRAETWIIEVNTLPAMTQATCLFHQCAKSGYTPFGLIDHIIQQGQQKLIVSYENK